RAEPPPALSLGALDSLLAASLTRVRRRDQPDGGAADDRSVGSLPGGIVVGKGCRYLRAPALAVLAVEADQLGTRADREQGVDRLVHVLAHEVVEVAQVQLDRGEPSGLEDAGQGLGVAEREGPGAAGVGLVLLRAREEAQHHLLGLDPERAIRLTSPAD